MSVDVSRTTHRLVYPNCTYYFCFSFFVVVRLIARILQRRHTSFCGVGYGAAAMRSRQMAIIYELWPEPHSFSHQHCVWGMRDANIHPFHASRARTPCTQFPMLRMYYCKAIKLRLAVRKRRSSDWWDTFLQHFHCSFDGWRIYIFSYPQSYMSIYFIRPPFDAWYNKPHDLQ